MSWLDQAIGGFQGIVLEAAVFIRGLRVVRVYLGLFGTLRPSSEIFAFFPFCGFVPAHRRYFRASDASGHALATLSVSKESNFQTGNRLFRIRGHCSNDFKPILYPRL